MQRAENNHRWLSSKREMVTKTTFSYSCVGMSTGPCPVHMNLWKRGFARVCRGRSKVRKQTMNKPANTACQGEGAFSFPFDCSRDVEGISLFTESTEVKISNQINSLLPFLSWDAKRNSWWNPENKQSVPKAKLICFPSFTFFDKLKKRN